jgi:hypothetical protein
VRPDLSGTVRCSPELIACDPAMRSERGLLRAHLREPLVPGVCRGDRWSADDGSSRHGPRAKSAQTPCPSRRGASHRERCVTAASGWHPAGGGAGTCRRRLADADERAEAVVGDAPGQGDEQAPRLLVFDARMGGRRHLAPLCA